jgi:hypothetical protein
MNSNPKISFHEASLVRSAYVGTTMTLEIEGVHVEDTKRNVSLRLKEVKTVLCDGSQVEEVRAEDCEILTLESTMTSLYLIIQCMNYQTRKRQTYAYRITCDAVDVEIL